MLSEAKITWLNQQFRIVYQENDCKPRRRHLVGAGRLYLYIGGIMLNHVLREQKSLKQIKLNVGKVIFYVK